jgi:DNA repair exonuclease SbcCD ATPase subunit
MNTQEAIRVVQGALNERKALAKMEGVLVVVADMERQAAELEARIAAQKSEVEFRDSELAGAVSDIEAARIRYANEADEARAAFDAEALVWAGKVEEIEAKYQEIVDQSAAAEDAYERRVKEMNSIIFKLQAEADAVEERLSAAQTAMAVLRDKL